MRLYPDWRELCFTNFYDVLVMGWIVQVAGLVVGAIGAGKQYQAEKQAASNQEALARYNYAIQEQNIRQQQALAQWSAKAQARMAMANAAIAQQTAETNARNIENQAEGVRRRGVEEQRRMRDDHQRFLGGVRARAAKSGVVTDVAGPAGSYLESVRTMALVANDVWWEMNTQRDSLQWDARMQRYGGEVARAQYGMEAAMAKAEGSLAPIRARMQLRQAQFERMAGLNQASGMRSAARAQAWSNTGSLLSSAGSMMPSGGMGTSAGSAGGGSAWAGAKVTGKSSMGGHSMGGSFAAMG